MTENLEGFSAKEQHDGLLYFREGTLVAARMKHLRGLSLAGG